MKPKSRSILILSILFGYIVLQFLWWEILLVKQNDRIINEKEKLVALGTTSEAQLREELDVLRDRKKKQTVMIVSEGTVFLLLLLFGIYRIKQAYDKETFLNNQQKNFFLSITHELKTPIAATKLQLQTLQKQKLSEELRQELIRNALSETERLNLLIDKVLLASRLETGGFITKKEKQNLGEFTGALLRRYYHREMEAGELRFRELAEVWHEIDVNAFPSVITNLVDNALKYSGPQKDVLVELEEQNGGPVLKVSDQGCGVSDADKQKIFGKFFRAGNEETRHSKGTGLGLYIVRDILNKHQALITVKDNEPRGSIFEIQFYVA